MNYKKEIGKRIKTAREAKNLTLVGLATLTRNVLSASRISNYEQGTRLPKPQEILLLAKELHESPTHLMCLDEGEQMTVEEERLLKNWRTLPENERMAYARRIATLSLAYRDSIPDEDYAKRVDAKAPPKKSIVIAKKPKATNGR